jgi:hypothetical protein
MCPDGLDGEVVTAAERLHDRDVYVGDEQVGALHPGGDPIPAQRDHVDAEVGVGGVLGGEQLRQSLRVGAAPCRGPVSHDVVCPVLGLRTVGERDAVHGGHAEGGDGDEDGQGALHFADLHDVSLLG